MYQESLSRWILVLWWCAMHRRKSTTLIYQDKVVKENVRRLASEYEGVNFLGCILPSWAFAWAYFAHMCFGIPLSCNSGKGVPCFSSFLFLHGVIAKAEAESPSLDCLCCGSRAVFIYLFPTVSIRLCSRALGVKYHAKWKNRENKKLCVPLYCTPH